MLNQTKTVIVATLENGMAAPSGDGLKIGDFVYTPWGAREVVKIHQEEQADNSSLDFDNGSQ